MPSLLRTDKEIIDIYNRNADTVYYVCYCKESMRKV